MDDETFSHELHKQLLFWQHALYLQDWTISLRIVRQWDMGDTVSVAQCEWYIERKDAIIKVLHPDDLPGVSSRFLNGEECDYDVSLVHELLHLHFAPFHRKEDEIAHEQAINAISRGIVKTWRTNDNEVDKQTMFSFTASVHSEGYL